MRMQRGMFLALAAMVALGACAPGATTGGAGAAGARPAETRFTTTAKLQLAQAEGATGERQQQLFQQALEQSLQGIESAPGNPQHYYLAGLAYAGMDNFEGADTMWTRAGEMFPGYQAEIMVAREQAWAQAFNQGVVAYNEGNMQVAVRHWERANQIFDRRPEAYFNLAAVYSQEQRYDDAVRAFQASLEALEREPGRELSAEEQAEREEAMVGALQNLGNLQLFTEQFGPAEATFRRLSELQPRNVQARSNLAAALARQERRDEAMTVYRELLAMPNLTTDEMMSVGVGLFQAQEYAQAADAFRQITDRQPNNRDAWYNYLNALYAQQRWQDIGPVGERLLELDPLNENAHLIMVQAFRELRQQPRAIQFATRNQELPVRLDELQLRHEGGRAVLRGTVTGNRAPAGSPVRLEFTFFGADGQTIGTEVVTVNAPAQNATTTLQVSVASPTAPMGYRYRVM
jgi:tetratricopeptide (TPR) repeat protein